MTRYLPAAAILLAVTACTDTPTPNIASAGTPPPDLIRFDPTGPFAQQFGLNKLNLPLDVDCLVEHGWEQCDVYG